MNTLPPPRRNPVFVIAIAAIAVLGLVALVSGYLLFSYLGSYNQRVAAPVATVAAALSTPADLPSPEPGYDPSITPVITPLSGKPVRARRDLTLLVAPFHDAPPVNGRDGAPITLAQGSGAIAIASTSDRWQLLRLDNGAEGWAPPDALE
jgi:hypothetical protein